MVTPVQSEPRAAAASPEPAVALRGIQRRFGGVLAVDGIDLELRPGEVVGLLGENGAGKSTLVKILTGVIAPSDGEVLVDGQPRRLANPREARELGIAATYQEPMVFPDLDVAENIFAGRQPSSRSVMQWGELYERAQAVIDELGVKLDPRARVYELGIADRQLIEIAKSLSSGARVLILDEPTAVLSSREIDGLFEIVRRLRDRGVALLFISHKLEEVRAITDRVVVLRDGRKVAERPTSELPVREMIRLMVGREISDLFPARDASPGDVILRVEGLTRRGYFEDVSFTLRRGEILGFAGLVGAGRTELAQALFGVDPIDAGTIELDGLPFSPQSPRHAVKCGIAYLPENRLVHGLVPTMGVPLNMTMSVWDRMSGWLGRFRTRAVNDRARELARRVELQTGRVHQLVSTLSGGNQQKVVLAKWLASEPRVLILDEPTHGIDVGTKSEVLRIVAELARAGVAVIMISSELEEVRAMSTRLVVMRRGRVAATLDCPVDSVTVMEAAAGAPQEPAS